MQLSKEQKPIDESLVGRMVNEFMACADFNYQLTPAWYCEGMTAALRVVEAQHQAELAEVKRVMGAPVTDEEQAEFSIHYMMLGPSSVEAVNTPLLTKYQASKLIAARLTKLEKNPDPLDGLLYHGNKGDGTSQEEADKRIRQAWELGRAEASK